MAIGGREQVRLHCFPTGPVTVAAGGRRYNVAGPLTAKLRCPVAIRARVTSRVPVAADRIC